jgi:hypothetical protein
LERWRKKPSTENLVALSSSERQESTLMPIRRAIGLTLAGAVIVVSVLSLLAYLLLGSPHLAHQPMTASELFDLLKIGFAVVAGVGGVVALVMGYRKQQIAEVEATHAKHAAERAIRGETRDQVKLFNERFATAASQLGSTTPAVSIAGAYAMAGLADDWDDKRQMCIDVLCGFLRLPYSVQPAGATADDAQSSLASQREVRNTVVSIIRGHLATDASVSWSPHNFDFTGAVFDGADLSDAIFRGHDVIFESVHVVGKGLKLTRAKFLGDYVWFGYSKFEKTHINLMATEFRGIWVSFSGCKFINCDIFLHSALVDGGKLVFPMAAFDRDSRVSFEKGSIRSGEISFEGAKVEGSVDFSEFGFEGGQVNLGGATWLKQPTFDDWDSPPSPLNMPQARP